MKPEYVTLSDIRELTQVNMHTEAMISGCYYLGFGQDHPIVVGLKQVAEKRDEMGYLSSTLSERQYSLYKKMMVYAEEHMSTDDFEEFYHCF